MKRASFALPSLFLVAGSVLLLFLLVLAGAYDKKPLNEIFWLQADTRGIPNAPNGICHWTLYNFCDERKGKNFNCRPNSAAYPFEPQRNFGTRANIPGDFLRNPRTYFYLSRFLYAFYIIDVFFASCALLAGILALFSRLGGIVSALCSAAALFCVSFSAAIMTACFVMGAKAFRHDGRFARVGVKAFAFTWTCVALLFLATLGFFLSSIAKQKTRYEDTSRGRRRMGLAGRAFGRRHNDKAMANGSRSSYADDESQKRMTKEYDLNGPPQTV